MVEAIRPVNPAALRRIRRGQFQLNIVRVADGHDVDAEAAAQVPDLAATHALLVEVGRGRFQFRPVIHAETDVIQPDAVFAEVIAGRDWRGRSR